MTRTALIVTIAAAAIAALGCDSPAVPGDPAALALGRSITTTSFEFRYAAGDTVDAGWQEAFHQWATAELGVAPAGRIRYHKYFSRDHMRTQTGVGNANAYADPTRLELHTIWPTDNHEVIHLYSSAWGRPVALWSEGLAVSYQTNPVKNDFVPRWSQVALHDRARAFLQQSQLIAIGDLLTTSDFRRFDPNITYPEAGSFMLAVRAACGLDGVQRLFRSGSPSDDAASVRQQFVAACGTTIDAIETIWRAMLGGTAQQEQGR